MQTTNDGIMPGQNTPIEKAPEAANFKGLDNSNYNADYRSHGPDTGIGGDKKLIPIAALILRMERAGHRVVKGDRGDFTCCKFGLTRYCADHQALAAFARQVGAV